MNFQKEGYFVEYYVEGKHVGNMTTDTPDRETMGYEGRQTHIQQTDLTLSNGRKKRKIKAGTQVVTECHVLCGRMIK